MPMHQDMWVGVELKVGHAEFFLAQMVQALQPPERTQSNVALQASGAVIATNWQEALYAHLDAFLAMARSVPEVIHACFGADDGNKIMRDWFAALPSDEQGRRTKFTTRF